MNSLNRSNISNSSEDEHMYDLSIDNQITEYQNLKAKFINEKALELKYGIHLFVTKFRNKNINFFRKKVDFILENYSDKNNRLLDKLTNDVNDKNNKSDSFKIIENYFEFCKQPIIDEQKLASLKNLNVTNESDFLGGKLSDGLEDNSGSGKF